MNTSAMNNSATNMETINNAANGGTNTVETANNETASVIRPSLGEMNQ
jgi:hypothetical protein